MVLCLAFGQVNLAVAFLVQAAICEFRELIFGPAVKSQSCQRETTSNGETAGSAPCQGALKESMDHLK